MVNRIRVWDLPTRVFHWSLVAGFVGLVITGEVGGNAMVWHFRLGYTVLSLLLFRLVWGFVGGHWSRFRVFVVGPQTILRYLKGQAVSYAGVGHNPLGSLSVLALIGCALLQVATGLISDDEIATSGPLVKMAPGYWVTKATYYHTAIGKYVLIALVLLHIGAIVFYRVKRSENLVPAMVHGDMDTPQAVASARDDGKARLLAVVVFALCVGMVTGMVQWAS